MRQKQKQQSQRNRIGQPDHATEKASEIGDEDAIVTNLQVSLPP